MRKSLVRNAAIAWALVATVVPEVNAQVGPAGSLEQLARIVTPGTTITLLDSDGAEFSGFITALTPEDPRGM